MNIFVTNRRDLPVRQRFEGLQHVVRQQRDGEIDALQTEVSILRKLTCKAARREVFAFRPRRTAEQAAVLRAYERKED